MRRKQICRCAVCALILGPAFAQAGMLNSVSWNNRVFVTTAEQFVSGNSLPFASNKTVSSDGNHESSTALYSFSDDGTNAVFQVDKSLAVDRLFFDAGENSNFNPPFRMMFNTSQPLLFTISSAISANGRCTVQLSEILDQGAGNGSLDNRVNPASGLNPSIVFAPISGTLAPGHWEFDEASSLSTRNGDGTDTASSATAYFELRLSAIPEPSAGALLLGSLILLRRKRPPVGLRH